MNALLIGGIGAPELLLLLIWLLMAAGIVALVVWIVRRSRG